MIKFIQKAFKNVSFFNKMRGELPPKIYNIFFKEMFKQIFKPGSYILTEDKYFIIIKG